MLGGASRAMTTATRWSRRNAFEARQTTRIMTHSVPGLLVRTRLFDDYSAESHLKYEIASLPRTRRPVDATARFVFAEFNFPRVMTQRSHRLSAFFGHASERASRSRHDAPNVAEEP